MKTIFYSSHENRLRAGWRIFIVTSLLLGALVLFSFGLKGPVWVALFLALLLIGLLFFSAHLIDKRPFSEYGFHFTKPWIRDFLAGNIMAALAMSVIAAIMLGMGWMEISEVQLPAWDSSLLLGLGVILIWMTAVSVWEEAYFRSYLITNFKEAFFYKKTGPDGAVLFAVILSSLLFGLAHLGNPNATWISTLNISIAGMVFAYPYIITKSVAIPVGMHLSWNYFQGAVFGLPVSGGQFDQVIIAVNVTGPETFTGGQFGPEAGAAGLLGLMVLLTLHEVYSSGILTKSNPKNRW